MHLPPVPWNADPRHLAPRIKCVACRWCCWALPAKETVCLYGGPFTTLVPYDGKDS